MWLISVWISQLSLSDNGIGDEGAKAIAAGLTRLTTLNLECELFLSLWISQLSLSGNTIGAEGAKAIAAGLTRLTTLNLACALSLSDGCVHISIGSCRQQNWVTARLFPQHRLPHWLPIRRKSFKISTQGQLWLSQCTYIINPPVPLTSSLSKKFILNFTK